VKEILSFILALLEESHPVRDRARTIRERRINAPLQLLEVERNSVNQDGKRRRGEFVLPLRKLLVLVVRLVSVMITTWALSARQALDLDCVSLQGVVIRHGIEGRILAARQLQAHVEEVRLSEEQSAHGGQIFGRNFMHEVIGLLLHLQSVHVDLPLRAVVQALVPAWTRGAADDRKVGGIVTHECKSPPREESDDPINISALYHRVALALTGDGLNDSRSGGGSH
jgi:hypothetical protein